MSLFTSDELDIKGQIYWYLGCLIHDYIATSTHFEYNGCKIHNFSFKKFVGKYNHILGIYPELLSILIRALLPTPYGPSGGYISKIVCFNQVLKTHKRYPDIFSDVVPSGSSSEKVAVHTSFITDFDVMYIVREEALKEIGVIDKKTEYLCFQNDCFSPAYVRLVAVDQHHCGTIVQSRLFKQLFNLFENTTLHPTLQILKENDFILSNTVASSIQGPAMTSVLELISGKPIHCDYVFALLVPQADTLHIFRKWINRVQEKQVFSDSQLAQVKKSLQCYIVPIGLDKEDGEMWRLSFSATETAIFLNIDNENRDVYRYAKLILSHWTVIPTYYLKTAFFWLMEDVPRRKWTPNALVNLTRWLFHKLWMFLVKQYLPHFFIPAQNLLVTKSKIQIRTYLQQCTLCLSQLETLPYDTLTVGIPMCQHQHKKIFVDKGEDIGKKWDLVQKCVLQYCAHMMGNFLENAIKNAFISISDFSGSLVNSFATTMICKDSIDALYLRPHIPLSAFAEIFVAAALRSVESFPPHAQNIGREKMLLGLNVCFEGSVCYMMTKRDKIWSEPTDKYEFLIYQSSISAVRDADIYVNHLLSSTGLRHTMLCLRELLLLSARKYTSVNLEYSGIHRLYYALINDVDSKITDINLFLKKGGKARKAGLEAINKLQATVVLFYTNSCVRERTFNAVESLSNLLDHAKAQATVDLHLWQLPLFDHCEQLSKHLHMIKQQTTLGYRSVELSVRFFCKCMSDELNRVLVYDRKETVNTELPKHMDLVKVLLSNLYSREDIWPIICHQLVI